MKEIIYVVKIDYYLLAITDELIESDIRVFSSEEKAEEFLIDNSFIYGRPAFFKQVGWYHSECIDRSRTRLIVATIEALKLDNNDSCSSKCLKFILDRKL